MSSLFPIRSDADTPEDRQPRVVELDSEEADRVFSALSSETARRIVARLEEEPGTQSDVAEDVDTSLQNVKYHLDNLQEAGIVEPVDTWYSSRGNEMTVYAPTDGPLVVSGDREEASRVRQALSRFLGGVAVLAGGGLAVQTVAERLGARTADDTAGVTGGGGVTGETPDSGATPEIATDGATTAADRQFAAGDDAGAAADGDGGGVDAESTTGDGGFDPTAADAPEVGASVEQADGGTYLVRVNETNATGEYVLSLDQGTASLSTAEEVAANATPSGATTTALDATAAVAPETTEAAASATRTVAGTDAAASTTEATAALSPGLAFFLGGLVVLAVATALWYRGW
jgi:DNA-binding transcriptional ArsR family regulator